MKRLSHVAFAHPIPIPGTHVRQGDFWALDGWTITDEDGCITLSKGAIRFYTYVSASCVEDLAPAEGLGESQKGHTPSATSPGSSVEEQQLDKRPVGSSILPPVAKRKR